MRFLQHGLHRYTCHLWASQELSAPSGVTTSLRTQFPSPQRHYRRGVATLTLKIDCTPTHSPKMLKTGCTRRTSSSQKHHSSAVITSKALPTQNMVRPLFKTGMVVS